MLQALKRIFGGPEPVTSNHPVFGLIRFIKGNDGGYWESEPSVEGKPITVIIEAGLDGPTDSHVEFFGDITASVDAAFAKAAPLLEAEFEKWLKRPFPASWREAFALVGFSIPVNGNQLNPWDISFDCLEDKAGHQFTAYFENGLASHVTIDG